MEPEKKSLYIETTIPSYATAWNSRDIIKFHRQVITRAFWRDERHRFRLCTSKAVRDECERGDPEAARRRIAFLDGIEEYPVIGEMKALALTYQALLHIPAEAVLDCTHLAVCVLRRVDFLLSWNLAHLGELAQEKARVYAQVRCASLRWSFGGSRNSLAQTLAFEPVTPETISILMIKGEV
jgi:hypothetical protein